jgi:hypothetical protein
MSEPRIISRSEKSLFKSCRLARHLQYKEGLVPKKKKTVLAVGDVAHLFLEQLYTGKRSDARDRATAAFDAFMGKVIAQPFVDELENEDHEKLGIEIKKMRVLCDEYCIHRWEKDKQEFKFLEAEWEVHVPVFDPQTGNVLLSPDGREVHLGARFDHVWESKKTNKIQIVENKTAASFDESDILLDIGDQRGRRGRFVPHSIQKGDYWQQKSDFPQTQTQAYPFRPSHDTRRELPGLS